MIPERVSEPALWKEPVRGGYPELEMFGLPGLDQLRVFLERNGPIPPIARLTGLRPTGFSDGRAAFTMPASGWLSSGFGVVGGGTLAILTDASLGSAIQTSLPPATPYTTAELSMTFIRPIPADGRLLTATGTLIHGGRTMGLSEVSVTDEEGRMYAHGTSRCHVLPPISPAPVPPDPVAPLPDPADVDSDPHRRPGAATDMTQETLGSATGFELLERFASGELPPPPIHHLTGMHPVEVAEGRVTFVAPATGWLTSPTGFVQGGAIAMLADSALTCAVQSTLDRGVDFATVDLKVNYIRPVPPDGSELVATGTVSHRGRTLAVGVADVVNAEGKRVALATGSVFIRS